MTDLNMADLYGASNRFFSHGSGEISTFLHPLLHSSTITHQPHANFDAQPAPVPENTSTARLFRSETIASASDCRSSEGPKIAELSTIVDPNSTLNFSDPRILFGERSMNAFPYIGVTDTDAMTSKSTKRVSTESEFNDFILDCERTTESSEFPVDSLPSARGTKRTRAAEVHNLSEKKRRSRINERIKALQNLIPNSNKTDKASMLDEAIEYLKQLQLQVQMLSMRNGVNLHPMYTLGSDEPMQQLPPKGLVFDERRLPTMNNDVDTFLGNHERSMQPAFDLTDQGTSFRSEPSLQNGYGFFSDLASSKEICREESLSQLQIGMNRSGKNSSSGVSS